LIPLTRTPGPSGGQPHYYQSLYDSLPRKLLSTLCYPCASNHTHLQNRCQVRGSNQVQIGLEECLQGFHSNLLACDGRPDALHIRDLFGSIHFSHFLRVDILKS
jgi:hypothetical protein